MLLKFIFKILSDFWYNECVPHDFKRTILRPFLKDSEESPNDPSNQRPISLLNTLMKIYEGIIYKRLVTCLDKNEILSPYQASYQKKKSSADHILIIHELFLEYRFNKVGPRGGRKNNCIFASQILGKPLTQYPVIFCFTNSTIWELVAKCLE